MWLRTWIIGQAHSKQAIIKAGARAGNESTTLEGARRMRVFSPLAPDRGMNGLGSILLSGLSGARLVMNWTCPEAKDLVKLAVRHQAFAVGLIKLTDLWGSPCDLSSASWPYSVVP